MSSKSLFKDFKKDLNELLYSRRHYKQEYDFYNKYSIHPLFNLWMKSININNLQDFYYNKSKQLELLKLLKENGKRD